MGSNSKYFIIGCGVFGAAAANRLQETKGRDELDLTILDMPSPQAASRDVFKIIRDDYANLQRMKGAIGVHQQWRSNPMFRPFYHSTGRVVVYHPQSISILDQIDKNRSTLGLPPRERLTMQSIMTCLESELTPGKRSAMEFIKGMMERTTHQENPTFVYNEDDGVVQWDFYMSQMQILCKEGGANIRDAEVERLLTRGNCITAIELNGGEVIPTDDAKIILAAGPWILPLLACSNITLPPPSRAPVATGVFTFHLKLNDAQRESIHNIPPLSVYGLDTSHADGGEYLPPLMENGMVKVGWTLPFRNMQNEPPISHPKDVSTSYLACKSLDQVRTFIKDYIPQLKGAEIMAIRSQWDGVTSTQTPLITVHPEISNLTIAGGGSYNYAKDAPSIGRTIIETAQGDRGDYGWDLPKDGDLGNQPHLLTHNNFLELEKEAAEDPALFEIRFQILSKTCYI